MTWSKTPLGAIVITQRKFFWACMLMTFVIEMIGLMPVIYMLNTYDRVVSSKSMVTLVSLTTVFLLFYAFSGVLEWVRTQMMVRLALRLDWEIAPEVFDAAYRKQLSPEPVNTHQLLNDVAVFKQFLTSAPALAVMELPMAAIFVVTGLVMHPLIAVFALVSIVVLLLNAWAQQRLTSGLLKEANNQYAEANRKASTLMRHVETSYAMGMEASARRHWYEAHKAYLQSQTLASQLAGSTGSLLGFFPKVLPSLALGLGAYLAIHDQITASMVFAASMIITKAIGPINKIIGSWKMMIEASQAFARINHLLQGRAAQPTPMALPAPTGDLLVEGLTYRVDHRKEPVLQDVSVRVQAGEVLGVVGVTGSGKSSLAKALVGIITPSAGAVRLDGVDVSSWHRDELGPHLGYVAQDLGFFEGSVAQNIARMGEVNADAVVQAAQMVGLHHTILQLPLGYDTPLSEANAVLLSGGQRQRLALARAVYGLPKLLVLDEANSALDEEGERMLGQVIQAFKARGSTVVAVTHRNSLLQHCDVLMVMHGGRMLACGPTAAVIQRFKANGTDTVPRPPVVAKVA